jgi:hypothetical protein
LFSYFLLLLIQFSISRISLIFIFHILYSYYIRYVTNQNQVRWNSYGRKSNSVALRYHDNGVFSHDFEAGGMDNETAEGRSHNMECDLSHFHIPYSIRSNYFVTKLMIVENIRNHYTPFIICNLLFTRVLLNIIIIQQFEIFRKENQL